MKTNKLDIFRVLDELNKKQKILEKLSEEEAKQIQPFVLMRWLTGCKNAKQIYFLNELVNPYVFSLSKHKDVLVDLLTICTFGKSQRYKWIPTVSNSGSYPMMCNLLSTVYNCSSKEAREILKLLSDDDVISITNDMGYQTEDVAKIKKELKLRSSSIKSSI